MKLARPPFLTLVAEPLDDVDLGAALGGVGGALGDRRLHPQRRVLALQLLELDARGQHAVPEEVAGGEHVAVEPVVELPERLARAVLGGALLAGALRVEHHAEAERSAGDLDRVARGLGAGAQTVGVVVLAAVGPVVADLVTVELVVELGLAPRVAGERRAGGGLEAVAAGRGDAVRRALAQPVRRQQELHPAVSVLLGGALPLPAAVGLAPRARPRGLPRRARWSRRPRRPPRRWTPVRPPAGRSAGAVSRPPSGRTSGRTASRRTPRPRSTRGRRARWSAWLPWTWLEVRGSFPLWWPPPRSGSRLCWAHGRVDGEDLGPGTASECGTGPPGRIKLGGPAR